MTLLLTDTMHLFTKASIVCSVTHENARHFQDQLGIDMILSDPPETSIRQSNGVSHDSRGEANKQTHFLFRSRFFNHLPRLLRMS